jgi:hypothetical protein
MKFILLKEIYEIPGAARLIKHKRIFWQVFSRNQRSCVQNSSKVDYTNFKRTKPTIAREREECECKVGLPFVPSTALLYK